MYYAAVCDSVKTILSASAPGKAFGKVLLIDSESLEIISNYINFTSLLELGYLDVVRIGLPITTAVSKEQTFNRALQNLQVTVIVSNISAVESEILVEDSTIKLFDLILLCPCNPRLLQRLARKDIGAVSKINRIIESSINYICWPNGLFHCRSSLPLSPESNDWSTDDYNRVKKAVELLVNLCANTTSATGANPARAVPQIVMSRTSKVANVVSELFTDCWIQKNGESNVTSSDCTLVILERSEDPVVPCLIPWTYLGMINEYLHVDNGLITLDDHTRINLSFRDDSFFRANYNKSFGELANLLTTAVNALPTNITEFETVKKSRIEYENHAKIIHQITEILNKRRVFDLWEIEQQILQSSSLTKNDTIIKALSAMADDETIDAAALQRLISLIKIKCKYILQEEFPSAPWIDRVPNPTGNSLIQSFYQNVTYKMANRMGFKNSDYVPLIHKIIPMLLKGQLPSRMHCSTPMSANPPRHLVAFILGRVYAVESPLANWPGVQVGGLNITPSP